MDKEQLDILDKIKKLIKENEKLKVNNDKLKKQNRLLKQEVIMSKCRGDIPPLNGMVITVLKDGTHCNELPKGTLALALSLDYLENKEGN